MSYAILVLIAAAAWWSTIWFGYWLGERRERRRSVERCRATFAAGIDVGVLLGRSRQARGAQASTGFMESLAREIEEARR